MLGLGNSLISGTTSEQLYSVVFDGTGDYIDMNDVLDLGEEDFSISLWFKCSDTTNQRLFTKYQDANNEIRLATNATDKIHWKVVSSVSGGNEIICNFAGGKGLDGTDGGDDLQGTWIHLCVTADRDGNGAIYVNGVTTNYGKSATALGREGDNLDNSGKWYVGKLGSNYVTGNIDEVAIWNVPLDSDAVNAVYNSGTPFDLTSDRGNYDNSSSLQGYWRMDDGSGLRVTDSVGSNDGTLTNDAAFSTDTPPDD
tara:strand:- start:292 stop:1053 length:762 start_codon:yes stop_codon:yes gene_type:complete